MAHVITEVPGSSDYFTGGLVTYSNDLKTGLVDVPPEVLEAHGAVSAQVARAMAEGARRRLAVDLAVAVPGSPPDGGTAAKPVGSHHRRRDGRATWGGEPVTATGPATST